MHSVEHFCCVNSQWDMGKIDFQPNNYFHVHALVGRNLSKAFDDSITLHEVMHERIRAEMET